MHHKTNQEVLQEYAAANNMELHFNEVSYPEPVYRKNRQRFKRKAWLSDKENPNAYFAWHSDHYGTAGELNTYCGAFWKSNQPLDIKLDMRKKDLLDRLSLSSKSTGIKGIDTKFVTVSTNWKIPGAVSGNPRLLDEIHQSLKLYGNLHFSMNHVRPEFIPETNKHSFVSIYLPEIWITDAEIITTMLHKIKTIGKEIDGAEQW